MSIYPTLINVLSYFCRYFVLTRDYLHCFKRASGSANERASDMGQFIFKVSDNCSVKIIEVHIVALKRKFI